MKTYKTFLAEADTSSATKTEMAIVYAYNKIKYPEKSPKEILAEGKMNKNKWEVVGKEVRKVGRLTAEAMIVKKIGGASLIHAGSSSAETKYVGGSDTTSKADLYSSDDPAQRFSLKAGGGAQLMSAKSGEATGVFNYGLKHYINNNEKEIKTGIEEARKILEEDMAESSRSKMFVEVGKSKDTFGDWFILKSHRDGDIETEFNSSAFSKFNTKKYLEFNKKKKEYTVRDITGGVKSGKAGNEWYVHMKAELQILNIVAGNAKQAQGNLFKFPSYKLLNKLEKDMKGKKGSLKISERELGKDFKQLKPFTKAHLNPYYQEFQELGNAKIGDVTVSQSNLKNATPADLNKTNLRGQIIDVIQISVKAQGWKDELLKFFKANEELKKWVVYEAASGYGKFIGLASGKSSYKTGQTDADHAVANKLLVFEAKGGVAANKDVMKWSMKNGNLINDMDISFKGSGTARYIKFGIPTKTESVMHEQADSILDNIIDNEFIKLEADIYHLSQLDEGFMDFIKGTYKKAKDYAAAAANKLKELVVKFYENVIKVFMKYVKEWIAKGFDFFMKMMGLTVDGSVSIKDASF